MKLRFINETWRGVEGIRNGTPMAFGGKLDENRNLKAYYLSNGFSGDLMESTAHIDYCLGGTECTPSERLPLERALKKNNVQYLVINPFTS